MADDTPIDPTPVYIGSAAAKALANPLRTAPGPAIMHSRTDPCGHILSGEPVPTFDVFVYDCEEYYGDRIDTCSVCGGSLNV